MLNIGVIGYSSKDFDEKSAKALLSLAIDIAIESHLKKKDEVMIVSGLSDVGIPSLAYDIAKKNKWKTMGVACKLVMDYDLFPVDEKKIVGEEWGDESQTLIDNIDVLIRVGGGWQSAKEVEMARIEKIPVYEYDLPKTKKR